MDLDDLTEMIEGRGSKKQIFAGDSDNDSDAPDEVKAVSHLIDDDEQEKSDLEDEIDDGSDSDDDGGNTDLGSGDDDDEEDEGVDFDMDEEDTGEEKGDNMVDNEDGSADGENETADWNEEEGDENNEGDEEEDDEEGDEDEDGDDNEGQIDSASHTYQPSKGEDIYGRMTADAVTESATGGKYVPPARRAQLLATIDEVKCDLAECCPLLCGDVMICKGSSKMCSCNAENRCSRVCEDSSVAHINSVCLSISHPLLTLTDCHTITDIGES